MGRSLDFGVQVASRFLRLFLVFVMVLGSFYPIEMQAQWQGMMLLAAADDDEDDDDEDEDSGGGSSYSRHYSAPSYSSYGYSSSYRTYRSRPSHRARPRHTHRAAHSHHRSASRHYKYAHAARHVSRKQETRHSRRHAYSRRHQPVKVTHASRRSRHRATSRHERTDHRQARHIRKTQALSHRQTRRHHQETGPRHHRKNVERRHGNSTSRHPAHKAVASKRLRTSRQSSKIRRHESHQYIKRPSSRPIKTQGHGKIANHRQMKPRNPRGKNQTGQRTLADRNQRKGGKGVRKEARLEPKQTLKTKTSKSRDMGRSRRSIATHNNVTHEKSPTVKRKGTQPVNTTTRTTLNRRGPGNKNTRRHPR